jgi:hypothetical protein
MEVARDMIAQMEVYIAIGKKCFVIVLLAISVNRKQTSVYLSLMASTVVVAVMKIALNNSAVIIERRRDSDRWIPS